MASFTREPLGTGPADATRCACDYRDMPFQFHSHVLIVPGEGADHALQRRGHAMPAYLPTLHAQEAFSASRASRTRPLRPKTRKSAVNYKQLMIQDLQDLY